VPRAQMPILEVLLVAVQKIKLFLYKSSLQQVRVSLHELDFSIVCSVNFLKILCLIHLQNVKIMTMYIVFKCIAES